MVTPRHLAQRLGAHLFGRKEWDDRSEELQLLGLTLPKNSLRLQHGNHVKARFRGV